MDSIPRTDISKIDSIYCDGNNKIENIQVSVVTNGSDKYYNKESYREALKYFNQPRPKYYVWLQLDVVNQSGQKQEISYRMLPPKKK